MANGILFVGWIIDTDGQNLDRYPSTSMTSQAAQQWSIQPPSSRQRTFQFPRSDDLVFEASTSTASQGHQYQRPALPEAESNSMGGRRQVTQQGGFPPLLLQPMHHPSLQNVINFLKLGNSVFDTTNSGAHQTQLLPLASQM
jgi:hypothetical protein